MGRKNKAKIKKARERALEVIKAKKKLSTSSGKSKISRSYSVEDLMQKVDECIDSFQLELACKFCDKALQIDPDSVRVLDTLGPLLLEMGDTDRAIDCFKKSLEISPDVGHSKYLYLGQLFRDQEAAQYFLKGIEIMTRTLQAADSGGAGVMSNSEESVTGEDLSNAYCSLAEVYLTDSCFTSDADSHCHEACKKALEIAPTNPEAYQILASCLLSQEKFEDAKSALTKSVSLWLPTEGGATDVSVIPSDNVPPYGSRLNTAKLLLEFEEFELVFRVLEGLLREDDEVIVVWYLMGWLHWLTEDTDSAKFYLEQTRTLFTKFKSDEVDILEHTKELLEQLGPDTSIDDSEMPEGEHCETGDSEGCGGDNDDMGEGGCGDNDDMGEGGCGERGMDTS